MTCRGCSLESARGLEEAVELAVLVERDDAGAVVAAADELAVDPDRGDGRAADEAAHLRAEELAVRRVVELDDLVRGAFAVKELLRLDAEGSSDEA